jgi:hypothetical protein
MSMFRRFINELELREANLLGRRYTWSNERDQPTLARLDRWFCSLDWDALYPEASLAAQSSSLSDHCPILMSTSLQVCSKRRFHFEKFWTRLEGFSPTLQASWDRDGAPVDPLERLDFKIRRLARDLQRWSAKRVGSIRDQILIANEVIFRLDAAQDLRALSADEVMLRRGLKGRLLGLACLERTIARQRARVAAVKDNDASTQFFRINASKRRRRTFLARLRHADVAALEQSEKEDLATTFFAELLGHAQPRDHDLSLPAMGLPALDLSNLEAQFTSKEIWTAVKVMPANKSPGPDGFS